MAETTFKRGLDPRRASAAALTGRPVASSTISRLVRQRLSKDVSAIVSGVAVLARSGDPHGLLAASILLAGAMASSVDADICKHGNKDALSAPH